MMLGRGWQTKNQGSDIEKTNPHRHSRVRGDKEFFKNVI